MSLWKTTNYGQSLYFHVNKAIHVWDVVDSSSRIPAEILSIVCDYACVIHEINVAITGAKGAGKRSWLSRFVPTLAGPTNDYETGCSVYTIELNTASGPVLFRAFHPEALEGGWPSPSAQSTVRTKPIDPKGIKFSQADAVCICVDATANRMDLRKVYYELQRWQASSSPTPRPIVIVFLQRADNPNRKIQTPVSSRGWWEGAEALHVMDVSLSTNHNVCAPFEWIAQQVCRDDNLRILISSSHPRLLPSPASASTSASSSSASSSPYFFPSSTSIASSPS